jgi:hypothetical protein
MLVLAPAKTARATGASPKQTQGRLEIQRGQSLALSDRYSWKDFQDKQSSCVKISGIEKVVCSLNERHSSGNQG